MLAGFKVHAAVLAARCPGIDLPMGVTTIPTPPTTATTPSTAVHAVLRWVYAGKVDAAHPHKLVGEYVMLTSAVSTRDMIGGACGLR
jgi:hypothetical protein